MAHGLALPVHGIDHHDLAIVDRAVPGDCADVRYRRWRRHIPIFEQSLATSRDIDTTSRDIACVGINSIVGFSMLLALVG